MKLTKDQALQKIEELKQYVKDIDKPKLNIITEVIPKSEGKNQVMINGVWGFTYYEEEQQAEFETGAKISGHKASLFLADCDGTWFDAKGNEISRYLYFKPNKE